MMVSEATTSGAINENCTGAVPVGRPAQAQSVEVSGDGTPRVLAAAPETQQLWSARIGDAASVLASVVAGDFGADAASSDIVTQCADATGSTSVKVIASRCCRSVGRRVRIVRRVSARSPAGASADSPTVRFLTGS